MLMIHTADIHLGASPDQGEPWSANRKQELWDTFERLIQTVEAEKADLLLIAGDLFERPPLLRELREVNALFSTLTKTKVVLIAGNHDYIGKNSHYREFVWDDCVTFLRSSQMTKVQFPEFQTEVYGLSYHSKEIREHLYDTAVPEENGYYHILLGHGGDELHIPFSKEALMNNGFDYIALGHIHKPGMILPDRAIYSGCLEPAECTCTGTHGYVRIEVDKAGQKAFFVPFAKREYQKLVINISEEDTMTSLFARLGEKVTELGEQNIYDVIIQGKRHASLEIMEEKIKSVGNIRAISDQTDKYYDYEQLVKDYEGCLLQRYISSFGQSEEEVDKKALAYGTEAILEALKA